MSDVTIGCEGERVVMYTPHIGLYCSVLWTLFTFTHYPDSVSRMSSSTRRHARWSCWGPFIFISEVQLIEVQLLARKYQNRDINLGS